MQPLSERNERIAASKGICTEPMKVVSLMHAYRVRPDIKEKQCQCKLPHAIAPGRQKVTRVETTLVPCRERHLSRVWDRETRPCHVSNVICSVSKKYPY